LAGPQQVGVTDPRLLGEICGGGGGLRRSPGSGGETEGTRGETGLVVCCLGRVVLPGSGAARRGPAGFIKGSRGRERDRSWVGLSGPTKGSTSWLVGAVVGTKRVVAVIS